MGCVIAFQGGQAGKKERGRRGTRMRGCMYECVCVCVSVDVSMSGYTYEWIGRWVDVTLPLAGEVVSTTSTFATVIASTTVGIPNERQVQASSDNTPPPTSSTADAALAAMKSSSLLSELSLTNTTP